MPSLKTWLTAGRSGGSILSRKKLIYIFTRKSRSALEAYRRLLPLGVKRPGGEFDPSPALSAEGKH